MDSDGREHVRELPPRVDVDPFLAEVAARPEPVDGVADLVARARAGEPAAREELIERYLPLVLAHARGYAVEGLELADLVQEGCVGLLRALGRYDPSLGVPFGAYAVWWVRQALQDLRGDFVRPFRLPPKALRQLARLKSEHGRIYARERRQAPLDELARRAGVPLDQAEALLRADLEVRSLAEPIDGADGELGTLGDLLEDPLSGAEFERVLDAIAGRQLRALLGRLSERERSIVSARFGLGTQARTLAQLGEQLGVSTERVRQLEERALAKLRQGAGVAGPPTRPGPR